MSSTSIFDSLCNGSGARLAIGSSVLIYLVAYNEASATCVLFATLLSSAYGAIAAHCKTSLRSLQIPYIRASNKFDFTCLFLAQWMDVLAILCACGAAARTLSTCLDAMTGGLAHILILGRNSPANEPWPDVLGVAVVFLVTGMFMLGLEHSKAFSLIMSLGMLGVSAIMSAVSWRTGTLQQWTEEYFLPNGLNSFLTAASLLTFAYPTEYPSHQLGMHRFSGFILISLAMVSLLVSAACLSTILPFKYVENYIAMPVFAILDDNNFHKLVPAAACLLMLTCSGAFLELFPELYGIIVSFSKPEWKVLSRQISYESSESGNPVLAVFIAGSLCAMAAFACPLQDLSYTMATSHLSASILRAFYLLYIPFRPKFIHQSNSDTSLSYSRLSAMPIIKSSSTNARLKRSLWNLSLPNQTNVKKPKAKISKKSEIEKEWLLLGEPTSPCPQREPKDVESTIMSDGEPSPSDFEYPDKGDNSDTDSSTDIDALVDEYRQKIKVTTAGPMERTVQMPTVSSWRVTMFAIFIVAFGISLTITGIYLDWMSVILIGSIGVFIVSAMITFIPKYTSCIVNVNPMLCCACIWLAVVFFSTCAKYSWVTIMFWLTAGLVLLYYNSWCCNCVSSTQTIRDPQLVPTITIPATIPSNS